MDKKKDKIKICLISPNYPKVRCGVGDYTCALARVLREKGIDISVITSKKEAILRDKNIFPVIKKWDIKGLLTAVRKLKEIKAELAHIQYEIQGYGKFNVINLLPFFIKRLSNIKVVITIHEFGDPTCWFPNIYHKLCFYIKLLHFPFARFMLRYSDAVITTTKGMQVALKRYKFLPELIYMGSPFLEKANTAVSKNLGADLNDKEKFKFAWFGLIREDKGLEALFEAAGRIRSKNFSIFIIGGLGESFSTEAYVEHLKKVISDKGIEERIKWLGFTEAGKISTIMEKMDAFVFPYNDGVGFRRTSFISAVNMSKPVITTKTVDIDELNDRENVLFVSPKSAGELASAMEEVMLDEKLRHKLTEGAAKLKKIFSWEAISERHLKIYTENILRAKGPHCLHE